ncbi:MAG: hypothetical protein KDA24_05205 [Deltaproteobacteria bacterium]|nr:hypothetical protein [Deltaproteobacteria bacterium]
MNICRTALITLATLAAAGCTPTVDVTFGADRLAFSELTENDFPGIVGVPNIDDDNENGDPDWRDFSTRDDNDLATFFIPAEVANAVRPARPLRVRMTSGESQVRVWQAGRLVLGENDGDDSPLEFDVERVNEDVRFDVEFRDFLSEATFEIVFLKSNLDIIDAISFRALAAPLVMNQHLQPAEEVMAVSVRYSDFNNDALIEGYQDALGDDFLTVDGFDYGGDVWLQDEIEFGSVSANGARIDVVIDSIRDRGLDPVAEELFEGPEFLVRTWGDGNANSQDSFGNLEATPPVTVDGVHYPFGKVYWGTSGGSNVVRELRDMFGDQVVQAPFELDSSWLCVGHVDEFMSWIPDPGAPKGWRLVYTDIPGAWEVLDAMDPATPLPLYAQGHGHDTVGDIVNDAGLRALNEDLWDDYLEPNLDILREEANLDDEDILWLPGLFETAGGCGGTTAALIPGMANLIVANLEGEPTKIFLADPFTRTDLDDQSTDPMIARVRELFPADYELHFLDDFWVYHMGLGEVHCGSNVIRTPVSDWGRSIRPLVDED